MGQDNNCRSTKAREYLSYNLGIYFAQQLNLFKCYLELGYSSLGGVLD